MHRRDLMRALGLAAVASLLPHGAGCSAVQSAPRQFRSTGSLDHPLVGKVWAVHERRFVSSGALGEALAHASFSLLGEVHDNPDHHRIQAGLLEALAARGPRAVVFEQFDREYESALQQAMARPGRDADSIATAAGFERGGWDWSFYKPLVEIALRYGMPIHAGNLSRKAAAEIARRGLAVLPPERVARLGLDRGWTEAQELALRGLIAHGHCGALPQSALPGMTAAQRARDATLADALLTQPLARAVLIAGNGHVRRDLGVPTFLCAAAPGRSSCALGILEVEAHALAPQAYVEPAALATPPYDLVFFTPRWTRADPCAAFKRGR